MAFILERVEAPSKREITDLIAENPMLLDKHLEIVGDRVRTKGETMWDLVGVDRDKKMVLIGVELRYTYKMLYHIVNRLDWAREHMDIITRIYPSSGIDATQTPRAIVIAPSYSPSFKKIISYLTHLRFNLFTYACLESEAGKGILLEPVEIRVKHEDDPGSDYRNMQSAEVSPTATVTTEEIKEFLH